MEKIIIVSDFDGTVAKKDSLYEFFKTYAKPSWHDVENLWLQGKIGSVECLEREFGLVDNLNQKLTDEYLSKIELDSYFMEFIRRKKFDFIVVSDGIDYFIKKILKNNNIDNIKIISNHAEFINNELKLSFPNQNHACKNKSGTCKCKVVDDLKRKYDKVIYIGDGKSDFCVSNKADILFAKGSLLNYCTKNKIECIKFENFKDIIENITNYFSF